MAEMFAKISVFLRTHKTAAIATGCVIGVVLLCIIIAVAAGGSASTGSTGTASTGSGVDGDSDGDGTGSNGSGSDGDSGTGSDGDVDSGVTVESQDVPVSPFLTITSASYGSGSRVIDVTVFVKTYVRFNSLSIPVANSTFGGTDPAPNIGKQMTVNFSNENGSFTSTGGEGTMLIIFAEPLFDTTKKSSLLEILSASYGLRYVLDVTTKVPKAKPFTVSNILFGPDPDKGVVKLLKVQYSNPTGMHTEVFQENATLVWDSATNLVVATVIGNVAKARALPTDDASGMVHLENASLATVVGQRVVWWQFYNSKNTNHVTPVLIEIVATKYVVRGIGTSVPSAKTSTAQTHSFGLVSGSDVIHNSAYYMGHYDGAWDGTTATPNLGAVEFNYIAASDATVQITSIGSIGLVSTNGMSIGGTLPFKTYGISSDDTLYATRHYSVNFYASV